MTTAMEPVESTIDRDLLTEFTRTIPGQLFEARASRTKYTYDVHVDYEALDYPTYHNRLLYYTVTDISDQNPENWELLRTVSYTYYITGQASNITIKDEDPDPDPVSGPDPAYDVYNDLALYYHSHGPLWRAIRPRWTIPPGTTVC